MVGWVLNRPLIITKLFSCGLIVFRLNYIYIYKRNFKFFLEYDHMHFLGTVNPALGKYRTFY